MKVSACTKRPALVSCRLNDFQYQVDPYIGCEHYCYYCYVLNQAETDWTRDIWIHADIAAQLTGELENIPPQTIYMGYYSDPYQPCEADYRQTRKVLEVLQANGFSASILTKSDLVLRDIDILKEMSDPRVSVSVAFDDNRERKLFEAQTIDTERRIEALRQLKEAGVRTGALVCPVIPYITDAIALIGKLQPHTDNPIWIYGLSITDPQGSNWRNTRQILSRHFPDLIERIEPAIFARDHPYWAALRKNLEILKKDRHMPLNIHV